MTIIVADDQMSLAIGKKGQNVRLAAKLVEWKIDIKNQSESGGGLLEASGLLPLKESPKEDFLEIIKNAKGFGEKIVAILFTNNVVNFDEVISRGIADGWIDRGMRMKLEAALRALTGGVSKVRISSVSTLADPHGGTTIVDRTTEKEVVL